MLIERAPAKVNLTLHVLGRRDDGYHALESLVAFAGVSDSLALAPGPLLDLVVQGPESASCGILSDNLVLKAARLLADTCPGLRMGRFALTKRLPVAAGIGGGSSDAAAALRLLARLNGLALDSPVMVAAARACGSDVPVCLDPRARIMRGAGEILGPDLDLPPLFAVLVNPRTAIETRRVFATMAMGTGVIPSDAHAQFTPGLARNTLMERLVQCRNDMAAAAQTLAPVVGDVIRALMAVPDCRLARMSGSGATCFGLFDDCRSAAKAAASLRANHPSWWIKPTVLR